MNLLSPGVITNLKARPNALASAVTIELAESNVLMLSYEHP